MTDKEILEMFSKSESQNNAFNILIEQYQRRIYWHVRKLVIDHDDANDITQDTFIKVWKSLSNFKGESQLFTWIYRIATNESLNHLAKKKKNLHQSLDTMFETISNNLESTDMISGEEIQIKLQKALLQLPDKQRAVFNMKYYDDLKYEDMSEITGTSVGALKASYHLAVKKIEDFFNKTDT
ncbi:MAG: RNA polymerase sigma factor [Pseudarcicella sp.]|nr:RNA polymerase sigma factor [Pseudarcicella sp.]MBP6410648.1 RNA polymerase sigma factor [Pseudarcicella sp.]